MSALERLKPHLYLVTPLGEAEAHFLWLSETFEAPYVWGCFQCETKENWWWPNQQVRLAESITASRDGAHSPIHLSENLFAELRPHILRHTRSPFYQRARDAAA